jgi:transposase-like protein
MEFVEWSRRPIDGAYPDIFGWRDKVRGQRESQCVLKLVGAREDGRKELLGI